MTAARTPFDKLPLPQQAGILCTDRRFQRYAGERLVGPHIELSESATAHFLRRQCGIKSRSSLATNAGAAERFLALRTEFEAAIGKIAAPR